MLKIIFILSFAIVSYAQTTSTETSNNVPDEKGSLEGRHGIDLILGLYDDTNITSITTTELSGTSVVTNAATGFMGFISYQYWFKNYLSFGIGSGALVNSVDTKTTSGEEVSSEVATVVPVLTGVNFYPMQLSENSNVLPYLTLYVGPYIGIYTKSEVTTLQVTQETIVETVIGTRLGAGIDFLIGNLFKLGLSVGYHFMSDFSQPIGSEQNYSGPSYSLVFGFIF